MAGRTGRPGHSPCPPGSGSPDHYAEPLKVRVEIITIGGQEGAALRAAQAKVIRELLLWVADEHTDTA